MEARVRPSGGEEGEREREQWSKWGEGERTERRGGLLTTREQVGGGMARGGMAPAPLVATVKGERERESCQEGPRCRFLNHFPFSFPRF